MSATARVGIVTLKGRIFALILHFVSACNHFLSFDSFVSNKMICQAQKMPQGKIKMLFKK